MNHASDGTKVRLSERKTKEKTLKKATAVALVPTNHHSGSKFFTLNCSLFTYLNCTQSTLAEPSSQVTKRSFTPRERAAFLILDETVVQGVPRFTCTVATGAAVALPKRNDKVAFPLVLTITEAVFPLTLLKSTSL
jgi:hypothetical protein